MSLCVVGSDMSGLSIGPDICLKEVKISHQNCGGDITSAQLWH